MKLRDRLQKNTNNGSTELSQKYNSEFTIGDIFAETQYSREFITSLALEKRNIILVSEKSFDKIIIADYFKSQLTKTNVKIIDNIESKIENLHGRINILPNPDIPTIVKILEQIVQGCQSFIFGLNLGAYDNIINKLKVLIALNYRNLTDTDIVTLLGAMNPVVVYISKNNDGLFFVSKIDEINYDETQTGLTITTLKSDINIAEDDEVQQDEVQENNMEEPIQTDENIIVEEPVIEEPQEENIVEEEIVEPSTVADENDIIVEPEIENEKNQEILQEQEIEIESVISQNVEKESEIPINDEEPKKLNKYQLLKEKIKKKKLENT